MHLNTPCIHCSWGDI